MSADIFYTIGATHQVCQDFAFTNGNSYVIISDGCSSAKDSDWGARLLTKALDVTFQMRKDFELDKMEYLAILTTEALNLALYYSKVLKLNKECLAATLLCAYKTDEGIHAFISGDGYIIAETNDDLLLVTDHDYESGAPYYPYYKLDDELVLSYKKTFGNAKLKIDTSEVYNKRKVLKNSHIVNSDKGISHYFYPKDEFKCVGIVTDGLRSFVKQVKNHTSIINESVPFENLIGEFFNFKTYDGQYVHRRCQKAFRDFHSNNIKNNDDFAIGVIRN